MNPKNTPYNLSLPLVALLALGLVISGIAPVFAQTGTATSTATPSNATPAVGAQITATINIDASGVNSPDNALGSYTGTLNWNTAVLSYQSYSGAPPSGFTGVVNTTNAGTGQITFNGANAAGATGNTIVLVVTFNVVGAGTSDLDLEYSAMAATSFNNLLGVLTVNDGQVVAPPFSYIGSIGSGTQSGTGNATLTIAVPNTTSITAGDAIIIAYATDAAPDIELTITNSWSTTDKYQLAAMAVSSGQNRTFIFAAYNVSGLTAGAGNTITITQTIPTSGTTPSYRAAVAAEFRGLAPIGALEQSSNGPANTTATSSATPSSGSIITVQPVQLLIGAVGRKGVTTTEGAGTWDGEFTDGPFVNGLSTGEDVSMGYKIVSSAGSYTASKTIPTARYWTATIASFKTSTTGNISYIGDIGRAQSKTAGPSLDITTTTAVASGDNIMIAFAADVTAGTPTVSDGANSYTFITGADAVSTAHVRTTIFAAYNVAALPSGSHIVITHDNLTARAAVASVFRGLSTSGALDQTHTGYSTSAGTTPSSGVTGTTTQADELLIGSVGTEGGNYDAPGTWSTAFSQGPRMGTSYGTNSSAATDITASMGWKIVSATSAYTAAKGGIGSKPWAASIATFKGGTDVVSPTVTINQASGQLDPTSSSPINFTVVFSEAVTDFATGDVNLSGGTAPGTLTGTVTGSGTTYNVAVSGMTGSGTVIASINAGVAHDAASNPNSASTSTDNSVTFNYDVTSPTVTINKASGQADPTNTSPINYSVVFSEDVTDFATGDVDLSGSTAPGTLTGNVTGSGTTYNVAVSGMTGAGTVVASIAAGMAHDAAGNPNSLSSSTDNTVAYIAPALRVEGAVSSNTAASGSSITVSHTTGTGTDRLMLAGVSWNSSGSATSISSITFSYGAGPTVVTMNPVVTRKHASQNRYSALYSLLAPPSGQAGTVTVTFSASVSAGIMAGVANFAGVNQTTPLGTTNGADGQSTAPSVTLTGLNGNELVFDNVFQGASSSSQTLTVGPGQTQLWNPDYAANLRAAASTEQATGSSVTMSWTAVSSTYWVIVAVPINPAPAVATHDLTMAVSPDGSGTTTPAVGVHPYDAGTVVNVSAAPADGYAFDHWSGGLTGSANPTTITMDGDKTVTASFALVQAQVYVSSTTDPVAALIYPNTAWNKPPEPDGYPGGVTDDWGFTGTQPLSVYVVPEVGKVFNECTLTLQWNDSRLQYESEDFGSTANGLFGSFYVGALHSATPSGNELTIHGSRTDNFTTATGDYIARVDFTLKTPGYSSIAVTNPTFLRLTPASSVPVLTHQGEVKAYLGDVANSSNGNSGDGKINSTDLSPWSLAYWSGYPGDGMSSYRIKHDVGPTADHSVYTLPGVDGKIDFEDLMIFAIGYNLSATHVLPKVAAQADEPMNVYEGIPSIVGGETRIPVHISGTIVDVRGMSLVLSGRFGKFLGVEKGALLVDYTTPIAVMARSEAREVYVDLAVVGLNAKGLDSKGEVVVLRFEGSAEVGIVRAECRNSANETLKSRVTEQASLLPKEYGLEQNYPNPFNPVTTIGYQVPATANVEIGVYNVLGEKVATLVNEVKEAGMYSVEWNGKDNAGRQVASGVYLYRMSAGEYTAMKKVLLLK